jgi:hypothetical protein
MFTFGDNTIWRVNQSRRPNNISWGEERDVAVCQKYLFSMRNGVLRERIR